MANAIQKIFDTAKQRRWLLTIFLAIVLVEPALAAGTAPIYSGNTVQDYETGLDPYACPAQASVMEGSVFGQVIERVYHRWREIRTPSADGSSALCIVQELPNFAILTRAQASDFRKASSQWRTQLDAALQNESPEILSPDDPRLNVPAAPMPRVPKDLIEAAPRNDNKIPDQGLQAPAYHDPAPPKTPVRPQATSPIGGAGTSMGENYSTVTNTLVYPYQTFGFISFRKPNGNSFRCSGFLVAPSLVMTAGHCVYNNNIADSPGWSTNVQFSPAQYVGSTGSTVRPLGTANASQLFTNQAWTNEARTSDSGPPTYDYGAIQLTSAFSSLSTFMPIAYSRNILSDACTNYAGYPATVGGITNFTMQQGCRSAINDFESGRFTSLDTVVIGGNSGGPSWYSSGGNVGYVGIVTAGTEVTSYITRFSSANSNLVEQWITNYGGSSGGTTIGTTITVNGISASPSIVASGGTSYASVSASAGTANLFYSWSSSCSSGSGGTFEVANSTSTPWTAPTNTTSATITCTLSVTITASTGGSTSASTTVSVQPQANGITITSAASANPSTLVSGGTTTVSITASVIGATLNYNWTDTCSDGSVGIFATSTLPTKTWTAPLNKTTANITCTLTVTIRSTAGGSTSSSVTVTVQPQSPNTPQTGWWYNASEGGRGYAIEVRGARVFFAAYMYRADGSPVWYIANADFLNNSFTAPLIEYSGKQTLSSAPGGGATALTSTVTIAVTFTSPTQGTIKWSGTGVGAGATTTITRYPFVGTAIQAPTTVLSPQTGWWWNPSEGGTGYFIEQQANQVFLATYVYQTSGASIWYYALGPLGNASTGNSVTQSMSAQITQAKNGQTLTSGPKPGITTQSLGFTALICPSATSCTITLPDSFGAANGRTVTLTRFTSF